MSKLAEQVAQLEDDLYRASVARDHNKAVVNRLAYVLKMIVAGKRQYPDTVETFAEREAVKALKDTQLHKPTEHIFFACVNHGGCKRGGNCQFCEGGLGACEVCNGFEGTLTTECPGRPISEQEENMIYRETPALDFKDGKWYRREN